MALTVSSIIDRHVVCVAPDDPLVSVHRLFVDEGISGAPVVQDDGSLVGLISASDLLRASLERLDGSGDGTPERADGAADDWVDPAGGEPLPEAFQERLGGAVVSDAMSRSVVSVPLDASIPEVARALTSNRIHRVLVTDGEGIVGIVSAFDLVSLLEKQEG